MIEKQEKRFLDYAEEQGINASGAAVYLPGVLRGFDSDKLVFDTLDGVFKVDDRLIIYKSHSEGKRKRIVNVIVSHYKP